ncbi:uncharacterized protein [Porites lutea]|uniref:uncharacterized protein n=1 Tax=Porites lutea TaxID=51062 RepID=UPI003CC66F78
MEFMKRVACQRSLSTSTFSIKNILNLEDESNMIEPLPPLQPANDCEAAALYSIPSSVVATHVPYNPSPFLNPCSSFGLQQYTLPSTWMNSGTEMGNPRWTTSAGLMMTQFPSGNLLHCTYLHCRKRRKLSTKKKKRPLFSQHQVETMEKQFTKHRYITEDKRAELSAELSLTETQVKTWFQNRRTKWRKELRDKVETTVSQTRKKLRGTMSASGTYPGFELPLGTASLPRREVKLSTS